MINLLLDSNNWSISDVLSFISIILVIIGGIFGYKQWVYSNKTKRADFINQIINTLRFDREIVETIYMIDYIITIMMWNIKLTKLYHIYLTFVI